MRYAVIFTYSFDEDVPVFLFDDVEAAKAFLRRSYEEELRIDVEENGWNSYGIIAPDSMSAKITNVFCDREDVTEFRVGYIVEDMKG